MESGGPPPPLPPPPPPPPPGLLAPKTQNINDIIRANRKGQKVPDENSGSGAPNMADVLKGLGSVKLRTVER